MKKIALIFALGLFAISSNAQSSKIQVSELPAKARAFLSEHYKYRPFESIRKNTGEPNPYFVRLAQGTAFTFAENGDWCEAGGSSLPKAMLPMSIANYLTANFPRKRVVSVARGPNGYSVGLNGKIGLAFDAKGKLLE